LRQGPAAGVIDGVDYYQIEDVVAAHEQGHEIGCHTFDHIRAPELADSELERSVELNAQFVRDCLGDVIMTSFAFPEGAVNIRTKRLLGKHFAVCRGTWPGTNSGLFDLSLLRTVALDAYFDRRFRLSDVIREAKVKKAWLVFYTHDISATPSTWGCTPELLRSVIGQLAEHDIEILPLKSALAKVVFG
jgi:peptidoglycan/xylan/chitin deacetylase (PgdA/CDA1 family)